MQKSDFHSGDVHRWLSGGIPAAFITLLITACCKPAEFPHSPDRDFVTAAATANLDGIAAGNLAGENAFDPGIRAFGSVLDHDDSAAELALLQLADTINLVLPTSPDGEYDSLAMYLTGKSGRPFDLTWLQSQSTSLHQLTALYQREFEIGQSPTVQRFARDLMPAIQRQQHTADSLLVLVNSIPRSQ